MQKKTYEQTMEVIFTGELRVEKDLNLDARVQLEKHLKEQAEILKSATECMQADCNSAEFVSVSDTGIGVIGSTDDFYKATVTVEYVADVNTNEPLTKEYAFGLFDRVVTKTHFQEIEIDEITVIVIPNNLYDNLDNVKDLENEMEL